MEKAKKNNSKLRLLIILVIFALIISFVIMGVRILKLNIEKSQLELEQSRLERQKENLELELDNISAEEYIEKLARRDLKLIKSDELLYVLPDSKGGKNEQKESGADGK